MATVGFGAGYTEWTYEREHRYITDHYDEWGYYLGSTEDSDYETLESCGNFSLKVAARADFLISNHTTVGLEFNWIPMLNKGEIVNNLFGVKVRIGGVF